MANLIKIAQGLAALTDDQAKAVRGLVKFIKAKSDKSLPRTPRKYKKRAPKAVEVAPGVRVTKRGKRSASEIDHSPRSVEEQG